MGMLDIARHSLLQVRGPQGRKEAGLASAVVQQQQEEEKEVSAKQWPW